MTFSASSVPASGGRTDFGLVSIVMPAYNAAAHIEESIRSVVTQTYANWQLLIVDDGCTDATPDIIRAWSEREPRIQGLKTSGRTGVANARSVAIDAATGDYIAFLDSDDLWDPRKLEAQLSFMRERGSVFSFTAYRKMDMNGVIGRDVINVPESVTYRDLLKSNHIGCLTALFDRRHFGTIEVPRLGRREDYRLWLNILRGPVVHEDYSLWLKLLRPVRPLAGVGTAIAPTSAPRAVAHGLNEPLAFYRCGKPSLSSNKLKAAASQWIIYREIEKLPLRVSAYYFAHYALKGFLKYRKT